MQAYKPTCELEINFDVMNRFVNASNCAAHNHSGPRRANQTQGDGNTRLLQRAVGSLGSTVFQTSPAEFGKFIADETEKWAKVIRAANIKTE
jgi:hypothetical protein